MVLVSTSDIRIEQQWLDRVADWHQFCLEQGLNPWEHLTTQDSSFYVSEELHNLRLVAQKAS
jgi:hypothetical protein